MNFSDYQKQSRQTAIYPDLGNNFVYPTVGLSGEAGEVANKIKKLLREDYLLTDEYRKELGKEIGDVLWYLSQLCSELKLSLDAIAKENIKKLLKRVKDDKIHGSGDNR